MNYHNRQFRSISNTDNGDVGSETLFHYFQEDNRIFGEYAGGSIVAGHLLGTVKEDGVIEFLYQHQNTKGELMAGRCRSVPMQSKEGKLQLKESWQWLTGDQSIGESIIEEVTEKTEASGLENL